MTLKVTVDCENAAFEGEGFGLELSAILKKLAGMFAGETNEQETKGGYLFDSNGNRVGSWRFV